MSEGSDFEDPKSWKFRFGKTLACWTVVCCF